MILPDGRLALKDFGGTLPPGVEQIDDETCELLVVDPESLAIVGRIVLPERSVARLSADGPDVYVVGVERLWRARWDGRTLTLDDSFQPRYRTLDGQTYGWDAVIADGAAWFLDDGEGSEGYAGNFRGVSRSPSPLHLVRVDLGTGAVTLTEVCGLPNGIVANPPAVDVGRRIAVGYDSANGVLAAFDVAADGSCTPRWRREQNHACHPILFPDTGELVTADYDLERMMDQVVVLDIETGDEHARVDTGSPLQSPVFMAPGFGRDLVLRRVPRRQPHLGRFALTPPATSLPPRGVTHAPSRPHWSLGRRHRRCVRHRRGVGPPARRPRHARRRRRPQRAEGHRGRRGPRRHLRAL